MANMYPERLPESVKSAAERKLFSEFKNMPETDDWTVIHSLAIANHPTQAQGEADFVIIIPGRGIFTLEVKGGRISYANGRWRSTDRNGETYLLKDPVQEANGAMHAIMTYVKEQKPETFDKTKYLFGFGVVFPDSDVHGQLSIPDLADAQIADISDFADMRAYLLRLAEYWESRYPASVKKPELNRCNELLNLLRPNYEPNVRLSTVIRNVEGQAIQLTDNQQIVFDGLADNERCLVRGSAGTGKTVLALRFAEKLANSGKKTALFCYNLRLAAYLRENAGQIENLTCGSFTEYMENIAAKYAPERILELKNEDAGRYYRELLPELFAELILDKEEPPFDCIIVDEAQDLMTEPYLLALEAILSGGLQDGSWCFFMDAEKQNLYHAKTTYDDILELLKSQKCFFAKYSLTENCRNSASIIQKLDSVFGTQTRYRKMEEDGAQVGIKKYRKNNEAAQTLERLITGLLSEGISPSQITVLSPVRFENSSAAAIENDSFTISETPEDGQILYCSIDGYKGLENSVIILTDIFDLATDKYMNRLYVGMTRARSALYIIASESAQKVIS